jgi:hypothetical protein
MKQNELNTKCGYYFQQCIRIGKCKIKASQNESLFCEELVQYLKDNHTDKNNPYCFGYFFGCRDDNCYCSSKPCFIECIRETYRHKYGFTLTNKQLGLEDT